MAGRAPPTPQQLQRLVEDRVREEVLYREALALGLDKDDTIVKRQLARKMEFLAEDVSKLEEPQARRTQGMVREEQGAIRAAAACHFPPRLLFVRTAAAPWSALMRSARSTQLAGKPMDAPSIATVGDPFMFQQFYGDRPFDEIARQFGPSFAHALFSSRPADGRVRSSPATAGISCSSKR